MYLAATSVDDFGVDGLAPEITQVTQIPNYQTMKRIIDSLD